MTHEPSRQGDDRALADADRTSRRSIGEMLGVLRDRPSIVVGLVVAVLGQTAFLTVLYPLLAPAEAWLALALGPSWLATATLVGFVLWIERRPLASIGVARPTWTDLGLGVGGAAVGVLALLVTIPLRDALGLGPNEGALAILQFPLWALFLIVITAAVTEEVLFRAYPIERLLEVTGSAWPAAVFSFVVFVLVHVPLWGPGHVISISGGSVVLIALYLRSRSLAPVVIMHFLVNLVLLIVLPTLGWL